MRNGEKRDGSPGEEIEKGEALKAAKKSVGAEKQFLQLQLSIGVMIDGKTKRALGDDPLKWEALAGALKNIRSEFKIDKRSKWDKIDEFKDKVRDLINRVNAGEELE